MEIISNRKEIVFKYTINNKNIYSLGLSRKNLDGSYSNGYIQCKFKNNIELENKTFIKINNAWLDFFIKKEGEKEKTIPYIFINEFEIINDEKKDPYEEMADEIEVEDSMLPF